MIKHIDISGIGYELEEDIKRYARRKIGRLDRFVPRKARPSLRAEVRLRQTNESHGNKYECEVVFHVPDEQLTAHDSTMNMFAAIDIVEEKKTDDEKSGLELWKDALSNVMPHVEVRSRRVGGATFQIPMQIRPDRKISTAMKWLASTAIENVWSAAPGRTCLTTFCR